MPTAISPGTFAAAVVVGLLAERRVAAVTRAVHTSKITVSCATALPLRRPSSQRRGTTPCGKSSSSALDLRERGDNLEIGPEAGEGFHEGTETLRARVTDAVASRRVVSPVPERAVR